MNMLRSLAAASAFLALALAGCSDGPPSGDLVESAAPLSVEGSEAVVAVTARVDPINDQAPGPNVPEDVSCTGNQLPPGVPASDFQCVDPRTDVNVTFHGVAPDATGYSLFGTKSDGSAEDLGTLTPMEMPADPSGLLMFTLNFSVPEDRSMTYTGLEVRMAGYPYATGPWGTGAQTFVVNPELANVAANGTFEGKVLSLTVSGLPEGNGTWTGYLYQADETGALIQVQGFPVRNGFQELEASENIKQYQEFHIHLGSSKVNVWKATLD